MKRLTLTPVLTAIAAILLVLVMLTAASCAVGYQMGHICITRTP